MAAEQEAGQSKAFNTVAFLLAMRDKGVRDPNLLRPFELIPRQRFVSSRFADLAVSDSSLPIGCGQTIGPPSSLALMMAHLDIAPDHTVLEIGTGTGFGTAILSQLSAQVISVERFKTLCIEARVRLRGFHISNTTVIHGDGMLGVDDFAPFDRILIDASFEAPPLALLGQLLPGGRMIGVRRIGTDSRMAHYQMDPERGVIETLGPAMTLPPLLEGVSQAL
jgi:protein-L-isoaspartate(D-aspartate) O-methyltransferase